MKQDVVTRFKRGTLTKFQPQKAKIVIAGLKAAAAQAAKMQAWAESEDTIEELISWQVAMVAWWRATTPADGVNQWGATKGAALTHAQKTEITGFVRQQIDRWEQRLRDREAYRLALRRALWRVAATEKFEPKGAGDGGTVLDLKALVADGRRYTTIVADPPWEFSTWSDEALRSAKRHYDTMTLEQIKDLPVKALADDCAALLMWATWPNIQMAFDLIAAWGFTYKTVGFVWVKQNANGDGLFTGMGYYTRANTEPCLLAIKGRPPKRLDKGVHQVILSPVRAHSEKPDEARILTQRLFDGPYLELFARKPVDGWTTWGEEC